MSPSGSRMQTDGTLAAASPFWRRASRSRAAGRNTDGAEVSLSSRMDGIEPLWGDHIGLPQLARRHIFQQRAQSLGAFCSVGALELRLRLGPALLRGCKALLPGACQSQFLAAPVRLARPDGDQAVALQRQNIPPQGGAIHHQLGGQRIDRHGASALQTCKNRILGGAQPEWADELIIKLR